VNLKNFFAELKRRNVYKVAIAYAVVAWLVMQIATQVFPFLEIPNWAIRLVIMLIVIGFPIALVIAWAFELTPEGIKRTEDVDLSKSVRRKTGRKLDFFIIAVLLLVIGILLFQRLHPNVSPAVSSSPEKSIAVLPFENVSEDKAFAFFADGVQDEILTDLAKIADLKVISRTSVMQYKNTATRIGSPPAEPRNHGCKITMKQGCNDAGLQGCMVAVEPRPIVVCGQVTAGILFKIDPTLPAIQAPRQRRLLL
jgi:hypothetical protein